MHLDLLADETSNCRSKSICYDNFQYYLQLKRFYSILFYDFIGPYYRYRKYPLAKESSKPNVLDILDSTIGRKFRVLTSPPSPWIERWPWFPPAEPELGGRGSNIISLVRRWFCFNRVKGVMTRVSEETPTPCPGGGTAPTGQRGSMDGRGAKSSPRHGGRGEKSMWSKWREFPEVTEVFWFLSHTQANLPDTTFISSKGT
uniref:Uncharacterized protein n=1 Tax=Timema poppense TaxID=170557 RepID=A0A7R9H1M0_TIMPO|nr:unnamed protein product [Timema poppensis]